MPALPVWRLGLLPIPTILTYLSELGAGVQAARIKSPILRNPLAGCCGSLRRAARGTASLLAGEGPRPGGTGPGSGPAPRPHASGADRGHLPAAEPAAARLSPPAAPMALAELYTQVSGALRGSGPPWQRRRLRGSGGAFSHRC